MKFLLFLYLSAYFCKHFHLLFIWKNLSEYIFQTLVQIIIVFSLEKCLMPQGFLSLCSFQILNLDLQVENSILQKLSRLKKCTLNFHVQHDRKIITISAPKFNQHTKGHRKISIKMFQNQSPSKILKFQSFSHSEMSAAFFASSKLGTDSYFCIQGGAPW